LKPHHLDKPFELSFRNPRSRRRRSGLARLALTLAIAAGAILILRATDSGEPRPRADLATTTLKLPVTEVRPARLPDVPSGDETHANLPVEPIVPGAETTTDVAETADQTVATTTPFAPEHEWLETQVVSGDNMSIIFGRLGLSKRDLHDILLSGEPATALKRLYPGQTLRVRADGERVLELTHSLDHLKTLHVVRTQTGFTPQVIETSPDIEVRAVTAEIDSSLFMAGHEAGLSDGVIMKLAAIFAWDVDFVLDIREGDAFSVVYNEYWQEGKKIKDGEIIAAEFVNRGRTLRAIRYEIDGRASYFSDEGRNMRKAFLRTPVNFSRISSRFNLRRKHPILNRIRAHKGVDYAAPHGTPIHATGDGKIVFAGTKGGYGKTIVIKHGTQYSTLYAHMARFARGMRSGERISQGQTIGYVGQSGLATGPHLHYEFHVGGVHRDPLKVDFPSAEPIPKEHFAEFKAAAAPLIDQLDTLAQTRAGDDGMLVAQLEPGAVEPVRPGAP